MAESAPKEQLLHNHLILNSAKFVDHADMRAEITDLYRAQRALAGPVDMHMEPWGNPTERA